MLVAKAVANLQSLVRTFRKENILDGASFGVWARKDPQALGHIFDYEQREGMPPLHALVRPSFHPTLPLIMFNYTPSAHNTLYEFSEGWTPTLRLCRGIVFDLDGSLVALPFPKFFNYGEHEETRELPDLPFDATVKHDGHLGIVFRYQGALHLTTRGDFQSPTSRLAGRMLRGYVRRNGWRSSFPENRTLLVEIIHPETKVYLDYAGVKRFTVIGAYDTQTLRDLDHDGLSAFAATLGLPVTERWSGASLQDLVALMRDRSVTNQEGFVVRFSDGLRVKLKYQTYIGKMVENKLGYTYLMNRMIAGNLQKMLETLPEEIYGVALRMLGDILLAFSVPGDAQTKWRSLYTLLPEEERTANFQTVCRSFARSLLGQSRPTSR